MGPPRTLNDLHSRLLVYQALGETCTCGKRSGHVGWLVCALKPVQSPQPPPEP